MERTFHVGDTMYCMNTEDMKRKAKILTKEGYEVECKGWEGLRANRLTVVGVPKKEEPMTIFNLLDTMTLADCLAYAKRGYEVRIKRGHVQSLVLGRRPTCTKINS